MNKITEYLWLGDAAEAEHYEGDDIDIMINLAERISHLDMSYSTNKHTKIGIADDGSNSFSKLVKAVTEPVRHVDVAGSTVGLHCAAGQSRSPLIAAATIAMIDEISFEQALNVVRDEYGTILRPQTELKRDVGVVVGSWKRVRSGE